MCERYSIQSYILPSEKAAWDSFVDVCGASWRFLSIVMEHQRIRCSHLVKDHSFLVFDGDTPVAACQVVVEQMEGAYHLTMRGGCNWGPIVSQGLPESVQKKVFAFCLTEIDRIAHQYGAEKCMLSLDPVFRKFSFNPLVQFGYLDISRLTSVLDMQLSEQNLRAGLRRRYKPLVNKGLRTYEISVFDSQSPERQAHDNYVALHHKTSGRITRPLETFEMQYEKLVAGDALLVELKYDGAPLAYSYFVCKNGHVVYASSSDDPEISPPVPIEHCIIWTAIMYYKEQKAKSFEIGQQDFGPQLFSYPSKKDVDISFFKRGFGGEIIPLYRGVKYYTKTAMRDELTAQVQELLEVNFGQDD